MNNQNKLHGENVIPAGYKRTEVGVIPNDWVEIDLNSIVSGLEAGVSVNSIDQVDAYSHGKHILKTSCVSNGHFDGYEKKSILPTDVKRAKCSPIKGGIIVSRMNTPALVGEVGYVAESNLDSFLPDRLWQMKFKKDVAHNPKWLATLLSFPPFSKKIKDTATGTSGSMKNISKSAFLSLKLPWPTLKEQNIIGTVLSDADALITALEQLIAKKQAIKTTTMQQLLTGRTRLPKFTKNSNDNLKHYKHSVLGLIPEDWEISTLDKLGSFKNGVNKGAQDFGHGDPFINLMDVFGKLSIDSPEHLGLIKSTDSDKKEYSLEKGDVLFIRSSVKPSGVGLTTLINKRLKNTVFSGFLIRFRSNEKICDKFKEYCFSERGFRERLIASSTVSANTNINQNSLKKMTILFPKGLNEQIAIATILSDMDAELEALKQKLSKVRDIKQGMMQQLLTGRIRLPLEQQP